MALILIERMDKTEECIIGKLTVKNDKGDVTTGYTLEPPDRNNMRSKSCIPAGKYYARLYPSPRFRRTVILLEDVPDRDYIEIHPGNFIGHTTGCILPGKRRGFNAVWNSSLKLKEVIEVIGDEEIEVVIRDS